MLILFFPGRLAGLFPSSQNDGADNIDEDEHHDPQLADNLVAGLLKGELAHGEIFIPTHSTKLNTPFCIVIPESVKLIVFICQSTIRLAKSRKCTLIMLNKPVLM